MELKDKNNPNFMNHNFGNVPKKTELQVYNPDPRIEFDRRIDALIKKVESALQA